MNKYRYINLNVHCIFIIYLSLYIVLDLYFMILFYLKLHFHHFYEEINDPFCLSFIKNIIIIIIIIIIKSCNSIEFLNSFVICFYCPLLQALSSRLHLVSGQSWYMYVLAGHPTQAHPCVRMNDRTLLVISSLLSPAVCNMSVCLLWMVYEMEAKWLYSCCFVGCCFQDLIKTACSSILEINSLLNYSWMNYFLQKWKLFMTQPNRINWLWYHVS